MKQVYVCGFAIYPPRWVLLVRKKFGPSAVVGRLNGVGGKVEEGESPLQAMRREFREETLGIDVLEDRWRSGVILEASHWEVHFFSTNVEMDKGPPPENDVGEEMNRYPLKNLSRLDVVPNLHWLLPLCIDRDVLPVVIRDVSG